MRHQPVLLQRNDIIDDQSDVANEFGSFFAELSSGENCPPPFLDHERELAAHLPDFGHGNAEDYNNFFSMRELADAIKQSGSTYVGPDRLHYDFLTPE